MKFWPTLKHSLTEENGGGSPTTSESSNKAAQLKPLPDDAMIIIPLRNAVLFPEVMSPISIGRASSVAAAQEAARTEKPVVFLLQRDPETNDVKPDDVLRAHLGSSMPGWT